MWVSLRGEIFYRLPCGICLPGLDHSPIRTHAQPLDCVVVNRITILRELESQGQWEMDCFRKVRDFCCQFPVVVFGQARQFSLLMQITQELARFYSDTGSGTLRVEILCWRGCPVRRTSAKRQHGHNNQGASLLHNQGTPSNTRPGWRGIERVQMPTKRAIPRPLHAACSSLAYSS